MAGIRRKQQRQKWAAAMVLGLCVSLAPQLPQAAAASSASAQLETLQQGEGSLAAVYKLEQAEGGVVVQDITVAYNEQEVEFAGVEALYDGLQVTGIAEEPGKVRIIAVSEHVSAAPAEPGDMLKLRWDVKAAAPLSEEPVTLERSEFSFATDAEAASSVPQTSGLAGDLDGDGSLSIADLGQLIAAMDMTADSTDWARYAAGDMNADAALTLEDAKQLTELILNGQPESASLLAPLVDSIWQGDLNGDGRVSVGDLALLAKAFDLKEGDAGWDAVKLADSNQNGSIDMEDLAELAKLIMGVQ